MNDQDRSDIKVLILGMLDHTLTPDKKLKLQEMLNNDPEARKYYAEYVMLCASLKQYGATTALTPICDDDGNIDCNILKDLADSEECAPAALIEKPVQIDEIPPKQQPVKANKPFKALFAYFSVAALFFLVISINNLFKAKPVAMIQDSINAKWSDIDLTTGCSIFDSDGYLKLDSGIVKLKYNNATVILEGPCEFASQNSKQIEMLSGSIHVLMDKGQKGFIIDTPVSQVVDLSTEFGVQIHNGKSTEVHVLQGKASVSVRSNPEKSQTLSAGSAGLVNSSGSDMIDIKFDQYKFVRDIDSNVNYVTRGRTHIDLASITTGGNGASPALNNFWISPRDGITEKGYKSADPDKIFFTIDSNSFVDGIFVPKSPGDQVVSSTGTVFEECPYTCGDYYANFCVNPAPEDIAVKKTRTGNIIFDGIHYGNMMNPCLLMHANMGITYDLGAISKKYPYRKIKSFNANAGIADLDEPYPCNADVWVLVDGQVRCKLKNIQEKGVLYSLSVELDENDRFLTLVATDGGDRDVMEVYKRAITCDWCVFTNPVLELN